MIESTTVTTLLAELDRLLAKADDPAAVAVRLLATSVSHYHWVGIYWLQGDTLVLGPYVGTPTEHDRIPVGRGVCGTAVAEGRNQVVKDVRNLSNYLACSAVTRSEIVVLIRQAGRIVGQIDIDGHEPGAFDSTDEALLNEVAQRLASCI
jgi:GAF domain-containing protein